MARIAYLMLRHGRWRDRQLIPIFFTDGPIRADYVTFS
jgi:hypothetical protein